MNELSAKLTNTAGVDKAIVQMSFLMGYYETTYGGVNSVVSNYATNNGNQHICRVCADL